MKRRMRNRTYGVVGGDGLYPVTYPILFMFKHNGKCNHAVRIISYVTNEWNSLNFQPFL